jgi:hypothetical protein
LSENKTPYWWGVLEKAKREAIRGAATRFNQREKERAADWTTCACGRQDDGIERHDETTTDNWGYAITVEGAPKDDVLMQLGTKFSDYINADDVFNAELTLMKIEKRAATVLAQQARKAKRK